ncbi:MAG TPA: hypothetical protein ENF37_08325 [Beggiatoa sp.]|nr:hypothetical protein [Beggiatoa sp.]
MFRKQPVKNPALRGAGQTHNVNSYSEKNTMNLSGLQQRQERYSALCAMHLAKQAEVELNQVRWAIEKTQFDLVNLRLNSFDLLSEKISGLLLESKIERKGVEAQVFEYQSGLRKLEAEQLNKQMFLEELKAKLPPKKPRQPSPQKELEALHDAHYQAYQHHLAHPLHDAHCQAYEYHLAHPLHDTHCQAYEYYLYLEEEQETMANFFSPFLTEKLVFPIATPKQTTKEDTNDDVTEIESSTDTHFIGKDADNEQIEGGRTLVSNYLTENGRYLIISMQQVLFGEHFVDLAKHSLAQIHFGKISSDTMMEEGKRVLFVVDNGDTSNTKTPEGTEDTVIHVEKPEHIKQARAQINKQLKAKQPKGTLIIYVEAAYLKRFSSFQGKEGVQVHTGTELPPNYEKGRVQFVVKPEASESKPEEETKTTSNDIVAQFEAYKTSQGSVLAVAEKDALKQVAINVLLSGYSSDTLALTAEVEMKIAYDFEKAIIALSMRNEESSRPIVIFFITIYLMMNEFEIDRVDYIVKSAAERKIKEYLFPLEEAQQMQ